MIGVQLNLRKEPEVFLQTYKCWSTSRVIYAFRNIKMYSWQARWSSYIKMYKLLLAKILTIITYWRERCSKELKACKADSCFKKNKNFLFLEAERMPYPCPREVTCTIFTVPVLTKLWDNAKYFSVKKKSKAFMNIICRLTAMHHLLVWVPLLAFWMQSRFGSFSFDRKACAIAV